VVGWAIYAAAFFELFRPERGDIFLWIALAFTGVGLPALIWRVTLIRSVFAGGEEVPGVITHVSFYRDRGRAEFAYQFREESLASHNPLHKTASARALVQGQQVTLVLDPQNPKRAFIRHLFVED
jgi:hypothetical protein